MEASYMGANTTFLFRFCMPLKMYHVSRVMVLHLKTEKASFPETAFQSNIQTGKKQKSLLSQTRGKNERNKNTIFSETLKV